MIRGRVIRAVAAGALVAGLAAACSQAPDPVASIGVADRTGAFDRDDTAAATTIHEPADATAVAEAAAETIDELEAAEATDRGVLPPRWLGSRVLPLAEDGHGEVRITPPALRIRQFTLADSTKPLPGKGFAAAKVTPPPAKVLARSSWRPDCPVSPDRLTWLRVAFHGFDGARHTGELLVHVTVADDLERVFGALWEARFPIEEMRITRRDEVDAPPTGDQNNTTAFVCRRVTGGEEFSQHAYGIALDLNPFQNPYLKGERVLPELASAYLDRDHIRPGMITPDGPVVQAFADIGWGWGGTWSGLKDYHHFSRNGR